MLPSLTSRRMDRFNTFNSKHRLARVSIVKIPGGKKVRVDIVGDITDPLWCAVYTRMPPGATHIPAADQFDADDVPIVL